MFWNKVESKKVNNNDFDILITDNTLFQGQSGTGKTWASLAKALYTINKTDKKTPLYILDTEGSVSSTRFRSEWNKALAKHIGLSDDICDDITCLDDIISHVNSELYMSDFNELIGDSITYDAITNALKAIKNTPKHLKSLNATNGVLIIDSASDIHKLTSIGVLQNRLKTLDDEVTMNMDNIMNIQDWGKVANLMYSSLAQITMNKKILTIMTVKEKVNESDSKTTIQLQGYKELPYYCNTYVRCVLDKSTKFINGKISNNFIRKYEILKCRSLVDQTITTIDADIKNLIKLILK